MTADRLLGGRVLLRQPAAGFRAAVDPVLLAAAVPAAPGDRVLELGCGSGAGFLCLAARVPGLEIVGAELQPEIAALAAANAAENGLAGRARILPGDLRALTAEAAGGPCDHAFANPPFLPAGGGSRSPDRGRDLAGQESGAALPEWIRAAARLLRHGGSLTLIHRADRLPDILAALSPGFGAVTVFPLWPKAGREAKRVLVAGRRGSRAPARLLPGLVLHDPAGGPTAAAEAVLRDAAALPLWPGLAAAAGGDA
ncbi:MAG TPA: methyltransferase domain-containing protein [Alphaproteobacteria bacterium]|nr:methyltransferase domain-containing protein [Alphaproteobacteria bacterium]